MALRTLLFRGVLRLRARCVKLRVGVWSGVRVRHGCTMKPTMQLALCPVRRGCMLPSGSVAGWRHAAALQPSSVVSGVSTRVPDSLLCRLRVPSRVYQAARMSVRCPTRVVACCPMPKDAAQTGASSAATNSSPRRRKRPARDGKRTTKRYRLSHIYSELAKARLSALVVGSAGAGYAMALAPSAVPLLSVSGAGGLAALGLGTYLCAASANTFNQIYEIKSDARMNRTRARPLPSGRITPGHAAAFGTAAGVAGTALLCVANSPLVAALGAANIVLYAGLYTPLKQVSTLNTTVGAVVGAIPPLMGWAAGAALMHPTAAGLECLTVGNPWFLAGVLFLWQYPHFLSLSYIHRRDYAGGGHVMHSVTDPTGGSSARLMMASGVALAALPLVAAQMGYLGPWIVPAACALNVYAVAQMWQFTRNVKESTARAVFRTSLWYLPVFMTLVVGFSSHSYFEMSPEVIDAAVAAAAASPQPEALN